MREHTVAAKVAALYAASRAAGISPEHIAVEVGVSTRTIARWIAGRSRPRRGDLKMWRSLVERTEGAMKHEHTKDSDCTLDPEKGWCSVCRAVESDPCEECGGRFYHNEGCSEIEPE